MAIRGGYGISYLNMGNDDSSLIVNPPYNQTVSLQNVSLDDPSGGTPNTPRPVALNAFNPNFKRPMVQSWSLTVQRELPGQFPGAIGYVGTRGTNWRSLDRPQCAGLWRASGGSGFRSAAQRGLQLEPAAALSWAMPVITQFNSGLSSTYHSCRVRGSGASRMAWHCRACTRSAKWWVRSRPGAICGCRIRSTGAPIADRWISTAHTSSARTTSTNCRSCEGKRNILGQVLGGWEVTGFLTFQSGLAMSPGISTVDGWTGDAAECHGRHDHWSGEQAAMVQSGRVRGAGARVLRQCGDGHHPRAGLRHLGCIRRQAIPDLGETAAALRGRVFQFPEPYELEWSGHVARRG